MKEETKETLCRIVRKLRDLAIKTDISQKVKFSIDGDLNDDVTLRAIPGNTELMVFARANREYSTLMALMLLDDIVDDESLQEAEDELDERIKKAGCA